jgi:hypothetical protein
MDKDGYHGYDTDKKVVEYEALIRDLTEALRAQRTWVGLTDEDDIDWEDGGNLKDLVKAIESKLREKNT